MIPAADLENGHVLVPAAKADKQLQIISPAVAEVLLVRNVE